LNRFGFGTLSREQDCPLMHAGSKGSAMIARRSLSLATNRVRLVTPLMTATWPKARPSILEGTREIGDAPQYLPEWLSRRCCGVQSRERRRRFALGSVRNRKRGLLFGALSCFRQHWMVAAPHLRGRPKVADRATGGGRIAAAMPALRQSTAMEALGRYVKLHIAATM
jgi:hypothetical protein